MKSCLSLAFAVLFTTTLAAQGSAPKDKEPAKCTVAGQVVQEPGGRPIRKASLQLVPREQEDDTTYTADTDAEGHFKIDNIKPGQYTLSAQHSGFLSAGKHRRGRSLTLDPGQELKDLVLRLQPSAVVTGKILDNDGDPVQGVTVVAHRYTGSRYRNFGLSANTNDLGEYRISNLDPGRYLISANPERQTFQSREVEGNKKPIPYITYYPGATDKAQAVPVDVHAGDEFPANFVLAYGPAFRVRGTVSGIPVDPGLVVVLRAKEAGWLMFPSEAEVKKDGSFEMHNLVPGSYSVLLQTGGSTPEVMQASQTIELKDTDLENLWLTPVPNSEVRGQLRMENGQKIDWANVTVLLASDDDSILGGMRFAGEGETSTQLKQDGSFDMKVVPPGDYHVWVFSGLAALHDSFVKSINAGGKDVVDSGFAVSGGSWFLDVVVSSKGATVEGGVVDDKNQPVADAEVVLIPDANRQRRDLYQSAQTDQHGRFKLRGVNPGGYTGMALEDLEEDFRSPEFLKAHEGVGQTLHVDEGERKSIVLKLATPATN